MGKDITVRLISKTDLTETTCLDFGEVIAVMEEALLDYKRGKILLPDKITQTFCEETQERINCMPATLLEKKISGVKWVSVFPCNPSVYHCPTVSGVIILSELEKGYPFAIMDGRYITTLRTACMGAIGAKYLAKKDSEIYCNIGTGEQAKMHFRTIQYVCPTIRTCYIASRTSASEKRFAEEMQRDFPNVQFICCNSDYAAASKNADIIVTAVSSQIPLLRADAVKKGAFYCHVGGREDEDGVPLKADKIVCDDWHALKQRTTPTISRMYQEGLLKDSDIYADIADIIDSAKPGRETDSEFIYFNSIGLGYIDVAVAYAFYQAVVSDGRGKMWMLDDLK